jgi:hypothetical protein
VAFHERTRDLTLVELKKRYRWCLWPSVEVLDLNVAGTCIRVDFGRERKEKKSYHILGREGVC